MKPVKIKLKPSAYSYQEVVEQDNIMFIGFEYLIPRPLFPPVKRVTKLYCVTPSDKPSAFRFNLTNFLFCWFGMPFGPFSAYSAYVKNKRGIDFTSDVKANLNESDFSKGYVIIEKLEEAFIIPEKSTLKEVEKALKKHGKSNKPLNSNPILGYHIETDNPSYYIGLSSEDFLQKDLILESIYKTFYKHTSFHLVDLSSEDELTQKLINQGKTIEVL